MQEFIKHGFKVKLVETKEELDEVRKLRYEELILFHRNPKEISLEQSYTDEDLYCDNLIILDTTNNQIVGSYRFITKELIASSNGKIKSFYSENGFNVDDLKNQPYKIMELGKAAVKKEYRNGVVVKLMFQGAVRYAEENGIRLMFGDITLPRYTDGEIKNLLSYLYRYYPSHDLSLQPYALGDAIPMDAMPFEQVDEMQAKRLIPPILKAYIGLGCFFAKSAYPFNFLLHGVDILLMLDLENLNDKYARFILR